MLKKLIDWLVKRKVIEPRFYPEYPTLSKEYVDALRGLADKKVNQRFLTGPGAGEMLFKYRLCWHR